jgi:hypothetical protein
MSEEDLLSVIGRGLTDLSAAWRLQRHVFTRADVQFLRNLTPVYEALSAFVELKAELPRIAYPSEYESAVSQLSAIRDALAGLPIAGKPAKEIRALYERLPAIRERREVRDAFRPESRAPSCWRGHPMTLREGPRGPFWCCTQYPSCRVAANITPDERNLLS